MFNALNSLHWRKGDLRTLRILGFSALFRLLCPGVL